MATKPKIKLTGYFQQFDNIIQPVAKIKINNEFDIDRVQDFLVHKNLVELTPYLEEGIAVQLVLTLTENNNCTPDNDEPPFIISLITKSFVPKTQEPEPEEADPGMFG